MQIIYNYFDENDIPRVWGSGYTEKEAKEQCELALSEYIKSKPSHARYYFANKKYKMKRKEENANRS